jgi:hypothetical protein
MSAEGPDTFGFVKPVVLISRVLTSCDLRNFSSCSFLALGLNLEYASSPSFVFITPLGVVVVNFVVVPLKTSPDFSTLEVGLSTISVTFSSVGSPVIYLF